MKNSPGFSLIELLVVIVIILMLANIGHVEIGLAPEKAKLVRACSEAHGIVLLCAMMQVDESSGETNKFAWPGTNAASLAIWMNALTNYAGTNDLVRLFSADDVKVASWNAGTGPDSNAFYIYPVTAGSDPESVLLTSRNYLLPTSGNGPALKATDRPFGSKGAIVVKKDGSAQVITARMATNPVSTIGIVGGAPLN